MPWKDNYTISDERTLADRLEWPGKACLCLLINVNLNFASGIGGVRPEDLDNDQAAFAFGDGLDALLGALARRKLVATFAVPAVIAAAFPERMRALIAQGHEIAAQGLLGEDVAGLTREEERRRLDWTGDLIGEVSGARPRGWYALPRRGDAYAAGTVSANTMELLQEGGYAYMGNGLADDIPHYWVTCFESRQAMLVLPYYYHFDDFFFELFPDRGSGLEHPDFLARNWRAEFDAQYQRERMCHITLSPRRSGWGHRMHMLEGFLDHVLSHSGVWNATGAQCADWWAGRYPAARTLKLAPSIWQDHPGSIS
jgi:peptidoglycan/xylan/chitin deacetylase (PgdA/CDA1 family)